MSDDERLADVDEAQEEITPTPSQEVESKPDHEYRPEENEGKSEAELRMEMETKKRRERDNEEWKEYEEMMQEDRQKEDEEIQRLREKKERRKKEREEEEKRMATLRAEEEQRRRAEEEERQRIKREAEQKKREEREMKKKMAMEQKNLVGKRNFVITKRSDGQELNGGSNNSQQEMAKSKEQLENEKRAILEQRIQPLNIDGFNTSQLAEKAKELYHHLYRLEGDRYDLEDRFKRQQYDLMELAERARQMNKGDKKKVNVQQTEPDPLSENFSGIPPKIVMYSQYERVKDRRSFTERRVVFDGSQYKDLYTKIDPQFQIIMTDQGAEVAGPYKGPTSKYHPEQPAENGLPAEGGPPQEANAEIEIAAEE